MQVQLQRKHSSITVFGSRSRARDSSRPRPSPLSDPVEMTKGTPEAYGREMPRVGDILDSFFIAPDCCFRIVWSVELRASHCDQPAVWKGLFTVKDRTYAVWACEEHAVDLEGVEHVS